MLWKPYIITMVVEMIVRLNDLVYSVMSVIIKLHCLICSILVFTHY